MKLLKVTLLIAQIMVVAVYTIMFVWWLIFWFHPNHPDLIEMLWQKLI